MQPLSFNMSLVYNLKKNNNDVYKKDLPRFHFPFFPDECSRSIMATSIIRW